MVKNRNILNYLWVTLIFIGTTTDIYTMQGDDAANEPYYENEINKRDIRNIAILAYGSLVNQDTNATTGKKLHASRFRRSDVALPVNLSRLSSAGQSAERATRVIDNNGTNVEVWYATSDYHWLPNARQNLAAREGAPLEGTKYKLDNIFYMKKLLHGTQADRNERAISDVSGNWVIRTDGSAAQQLSNDKAKEIAQWANGKGFGAVIWASFPINKTENEIRKILASNSRTLANTKNYINNLPEGIAKTAFENEILHM